MPATFVRDEHPDTIAAIEAAFTDGSIQEHAAGVSNVQRVPWIINEAMVPIVEKLACDIDQRFKTLGADDAHIFKKAVRRDIDLARYLTGKTFWTPYNCDFRGRLNALPHFHIGREDRVRCLFMFANGHKVGESAPWLEIAVANAKGEKGTWRERSDWVFNNRELVERVAKDKDGTDTVDRWKSFKDPFQFVAACKELVAAQNDANFETRLPVFFDGTCNGIQHLALMTLDEESGRLVNLTYSEDRYDLYGVIAEGVELRLRSAGDEYAVWWLSPRGNRKRLTRGLLKRPVMTFPYGVLEAGVRTQIIEAYKEEHDLHQPKGPHVNYLSKIVIEETKRVLRRPDEVMGFIRRLAGDLAK